MFDNQGNVRAVNGNTTEFQVDASNANFMSDWEHLHHLVPGIYVWPANGGSPGGRPEETPKVARNPQIAMDAAGNFIIAWEASQDNDIRETPVDGVDSTGIYFRRFNANGTAAMPNDHQANLTLMALDNDSPTHPTWTLEQSAPYGGDQVNATIAMDVDGDYVIAWDGNARNPTSFTRN